MAKAGRPPRKFTAGQIKAMVALFNAGMNLAGIAQRQQPPCHAIVVSRELTPILGPLRAARHRVKHKQALKEVAKRQAGKGAEPASPDGELLIPMDLRERYHAGYAMALTHVALHGIEACHEHCYGALLNWREEGFSDEPPLF